MVSTGYIRATIAEAVRAAARSASGRPRTRRAQCAFRRATARTAGTACTLSKRPLGVAEVQPQPTPPLCRQAQGSFEREKVWVGSAEPEYSHWLLFLASLREHDHSAAHTLDRRSPSPAIDTAWVIQKGRSRRVESHDTMHDAIAELRYSKRNSIRALNLGRRS